MIVVDMRTRNAIDRQNSMARQHRYMGKEATFYFSKPALKELWEKELVGQISDGMWENTNNTGWNFWCNINTAIGENTKIEGRVPYNIKRNFAFSRLIEVVGEDMIDVLRKYEPDRTDKELKRDLKLYLKEISETMKSKAC